MDYEKKYKEALSRAATELETCGADKSLRNMIYAIFPDELKESKDETIRKEIIEFVDINTLSVDERHDRWIAWLEKQCYTKKDVDDAYIKGISDAKNELEKQGEQKPINDTDEEIVDAVKNTSVLDMVEPKDYNSIDPHFGKPITKFRVGEWVASNICGSSDLLHIIDADNKDYEVETPQGNAGVPSIAYINSNFHLWTIQDAKDGDVLISQYGNPLIYNGNYNSLYIGAYCGITCDDNKFKVAEEKCHWTENVDIKPATKEQRDTLEKAMADAGYTFDFEKKELKKIEQNPTWSDEDEENLQHCCMAISVDSLHTHEDKQDMEAWLKRLKDRMGG